MATKIQLRRGTAAEWIAASAVSPAVVLSAGEVGFETDTGKFKIGDGQSYWPQLSYAATLPSEVTTLLSNHASGTTNIHGIADTAELVTKTGIEELTNKTLTEPVIEVRQDTPVIGWVGTTKEIILPSFTGSSYTLETTLGAQTKIDTALETAIAYTNQVAQGLDVKQSVSYRIDGTVDTTVFGWLMSPGQLDKPALGGGNQGDGTRVLVTNAVMSGTDYSGIYVLQNIDGFWIFVPTSDGGTNLNSGAFTFVEQGTSAGKGYVLSNGTWSQFSDAGSYITSVSTNLLVTPTGMLDLGTNIVTADGVQTLSNKTLASPTITTPGSALLPDDLIEYMAFGQQDSYGFFSGNALYSVPTWTFDSSKCVLIPYEASYGWASILATYPNLLPEILVGKNLVVSGSGTNAGTYSIMATAYAADGVYVQLDRAPGYDPTAQVSLSIYSAESTISATEISYLDGVTSNIQGQLDSKLESTDLSTYATQTYVGTQISNLVDSAPGALNTLNELAAAINDDSSYAATVTNALSLKASIIYVDDSISDLNNNLSNTLGSYVQSGEVGLPDGVASLDSTGKIPASQLPATTGGAEAAVHPFALI